MDFSFSPNVSDLAFRERDYAALNARLLSQGRALIESLVGPCAGAVELRPRGNPSLSINAHTGAWHEHGSPRWKGAVSGGDLISLYAAMTGKKMSEAYDDLAGEQLSLEPISWTRTSLPASADSASAGSVLASSVPSAEPPDLSALRLNGMEPSEIYGYETPGLEGCSVLVCRYETPEGKTIRPWIPTDNGWKMGAPPESRPLFNLRHLPETGPVWVVEGEKAATAVIRAGHAATTSMCGSKSAALTDWSPLSGRDVIIWPDADAPGAHYAESVVALLKSKARSIQVLAFSDAPVGEDAADLDVDTLKAILQGGDGGRKLRRVWVKAPPLALTDWSVARYKGTAPAQEWLVDGLIAAGRPQMLASMGGVGKTWLLTQLGLALADPSPGERRWLGVPCRGRGKVVLLCAEEGADAIHARLEAMGYDETARRRLADRLIVVPFPDVPGQLGLFARRSSVDGLQTMPLWSEMCQQIQALGDVCLVGIDTVGAFFDLDFNSHSDAYFIGRMASHLASLTGAAVVLTHHMGKGVGTGKAGGLTTPEEARQAIKGSTALVDSTRQTLALWTLPGDEAKKLNDRLSLGFDLEGRDRDAIFCAAVVKSNLINHDKTVRIMAKGMHGPRDLSSALEQQRAERPQISLDHAILALARHAETVNVPLTPTGSKSLWPRRGEIGQPYAGVLEDCGKSKVEARLHSLISLGTLEKRGRGSLHLSRAGEAALAAHRNTFSRRNGDQG